MKTPGIPDIDEDVSEETFISSYNNFRKQTLIRYLDETVNHSPELKAKILDWKPEVLENKTRHQTTKARETTAYKEIFGCEPGTKKKGKSKSKKKQPKKVVVSGGAVQKYFLCSPQKCLYCLIDYVIQHHHQA